MKLLTVTEAAAEFYLPRKTVATWVHRRLLEPHDPTQPGFFLDEDVAAVEERLRRAPRRAALAAQAEAFKLR